MGDFIAFAVIIGWLAFLGYLYREQRIHERDSVKRRHLDALGRIHHHHRHDT